MFEDEKNQKINNELEQEANIENSSVSSEDSKVAEDNKEISKEEKLEQELLEIKDKYLRLLAEFENARRRSEKQIQDITQYSISKFAKEILSVADIFDKAFTDININEIENYKFKNFAVGIDLTKQELHKILQKFNITKIYENLEGTDFNPNFHEAVITQPKEGAKNNTIFAVFEPGYLIGDRLLRAAKVGIVKNN